MKIRKVRFIFQESLTADHKEILKVNFEAVRDSAVESMRGNLVGRIHGLAKAQVENMANIFEAGISFDFPNEREATFSWPNISAADLLKTPFAFANKQLELAKLMPEKRLIHFIKNDVSKDMGIDGNTITYEIEEEEEDTTPPNDITP